MSFRVHSSSIYLFFMMLFSFIYSAALVRAVPISMVAQMGALVAILLLVFSYRFSYVFFAGICLLFLCFPFNKLYFLSLLALVLSYFAASKISAPALIKLTLISVVLICTVSILHFYLFLQIFYTPRYFNHYFFSSVYRLLGLDGSPAYLSFIAGLGMFLSLYFIRTRWVSIFLGLFFLLVVLLTASRTATLGIGISLIFGLLRGWPFAAFLGALIMSPLVITFLYVMTPRLSIDYLIAIELATSHRVINWANLLTYFSGLNPSSILFGIGKPTVISDAGFLKSETGAFQYRFVTYAESSVLKILIYHGLFAFIFFFGFMLYKGLSLRHYHSRVLVGYFIFSAIFYDAIFSLQYIYLSVLFFHIIRSDHLSRQEKAVF